MLTATPGDVFKQQRAEKRAFLAHFGTVGTVSARTVTNKLCRTHGHGFQCESTFDGTQANAARNGLETRYQSMDAWQ